MQELPTIEILEDASKQVRIYPSDYKKIKELSDKRRTIVAQIIHEALEAYGKV